MSSEPLTTVYVTRHGISEHNLHPHVYMGRSPGARLLPEGREQARRLAARLAKGPALQRIVCSSLPRTQETAEVIGDALGVAEVQGDDAFWELSKGSWEGTMPRANLPPPAQRALDDDPFGYRYPHGESYRDVTERVGPAFERWVADSAGQSLLFVLHGDVIRALMYHLLRFAPEKIGDFETAPCSLSEFRLRDGHYTLVRFNDTSHLGCP